MPTLVSGDDCGEIFLSFENEIVIELTRHLYSGRLLFRSEHIQHPCRTKFVGSQDSHAWVRNAAVLS
jgi:hypothetical protein